MRRQGLDLTGFLISLINLVSGVAVFGLFVRFLFRLFGANPEAGIVEFIYDSTQPLLDPFRGIFRPDVIDPDNVLEYSSLIAIIFYLLFAWLLIALIRLIAGYLKSKKV